MSQPHPTPQKNTTPQTPIPLTTADLTKRCACSTLQHLTFPHVSSLFHTNPTRHASTPSPLQNLRPMAAALAAYCGWRRTVADDCDRCDNASRTRLYPQTPRVKREPFATRSGKNLRPKGRARSCKATQSGHLSQRLFPCIQGSETRCIYIYIFWSKCISVCVPPSVSRRLCVSEHVKSRGRQGRCKAVANEAPCSRPGRRD